MITYLRNKGKSLDKFGFEEVYINPQVIERTIKEINTKAMEGGSPQELSLNSVSVKKTLESLGRDNIFPLGELGKSIDSKKRAAAARINSDEHHPKHTLWEGLRYGALGFLFFKVAWRSVQVLHARRPMVSADFGQI